MGDLMSSEKNSLFPPCFIVNVAGNYSPRHCRHLDTKIKITLYKTREINSKTFKVFVPLSLVIMADCSDLCDKNKVTLLKLMDFVRKISPNWEELALKLELPEHEVEIINLDHQNSVVEKCKAMFKYWLRALPPASWCRLVQALYAVGLYNVAEEVTAAHLQNFHSSASGIALSDEDKSSLEDIPVQIESTIQGLLCESSLLSTTLCKRTSKGKSSITKRAKITKTTTTPPSLPTTSSEALPSPSTLSSSSSIQQTPSKNRKRPWRPLKLKKQKK